MKPDIKNLRRRDVYRKIEACLREAATRDDAPICARSSTVVHQPSFINRRSSTVWRDG
jgi:hypothetical protein